MSGTPVSVYGRDLLKKKPQETGQVWKGKDAVMWEAEALTNVVTECHQHRLLYKANNNKLFKQ